MNYMVHVSSTMWRIENPPSNSTSCSDNDPTLAGSCGGQIALRTSSDVALISNLDLRFEGLFWEVYFEGPNRVWSALKTSILNIDLNWLYMPKNSLGTKPQYAGG